MDRAYYLEMKTLTPLWTGDVRGKCTDIKTSGIIGSIRWWYEMILKSQGYRVCNPVSKNRCGFELDYKRLERALEDGSSVKEALDEQTEEICPACKLFGCTGWSGKIGIYTTNPNGNGNKIKCTVNIGTRNSNPRARRSVDGMMFDEFSPLRICFHPIKEVSDKEWKLLNSTLHMISKYGALGGRTAQGNGVVKILNTNLPCYDDSFDIDELNQGEFEDFFSVNFYIQFEDQISDYIDKNLFWRGQNDSRYCSPHESWKELWDDYGILPIAFHVRDTLRRSIVESGERHKIFGELGRGSRIFVSHGYKIDETEISFRVWGYGLDKKISKDEIYKILGLKLENNLLINTEGVIEVGVRSNPDG